MGGFNDPIVSGGGSLVYPSIHSPNYSPGASGWAIKKDGTAEFASLIVRETGGRTTLTPPASDPTGVLGTQQVGQALGASGSVLLLPGVWNFAQPLLWDDCELVGCGDETILQPGTAWPGLSAGEAILQPHANASIDNLAGYGGSNTRSANPSADFIAPAAGASFWKATRIRCDRMNGRALYVAPSTGSHGTVTTIKGEHNGAGLWFDNGTGSSVTAECNVHDVDLQNCETGEVLFLSAVTDVLISKVNGSIAAGAAVNAATVQGSCQTCHLTGLDLGGGNGTAIMALKQAGVSSPTDCLVEGKLQEGNIGLIVRDSTARCDFHVWCTRNQGDNIRSDGTGAFLRFWPQMNLGNLGGGTGYDFSVLSTAHCLIADPGYASGGVTANLNIALAGNHVTEVNPPSGRTTAGSPPAGW